MERVLGRCRIHGVTQFIRVGNRTVCAECEYAMLEERQQWLKREIERQQRVIQKRAKQRGG